MNVLFHAFYHQVSDGVEGIHENETSAGQQTQSSASGQEGVEEEREKTSRYTTQGVSHHIMCHSKSE